MNFFDIFSGGRVKGSKYSNKAVKVGRKSFKECFQEDGQVCGVLYEAGNVRPVVAHGLGGRQSDVNRTWVGGGHLLPPPWVVWGFHGAATFKSAS